MRVLIVEDNSFNSFCLTRLFETICPSATVSVAEDSFMAIKMLESQAPHLVILDGKLGVDDFNGPVLADFIWRKQPQLPIVAWTDHKGMQVKFSEVFSIHLKPWNESTLWPKVMDYKKMYQALTKLSLRYDLEVFCHNPEAYHLQRLYA